MARGGKKKNNKKDETGKVEEPPSLSSLSISEPSTSRETSAPSEEGGLGLTGGAEKKNTAPDTAAASQSELKAQPNVEEEEVGLGLGGGGKKRKPRKKKEAPQAEPSNKPAPIPPAQAPGFSGPQQPQGHPAQQAPGPPRAQPPPGWGATQAPGFSGPQQPQGHPAQQAPGPPRAQPPPGWGATQAPGFSGPQQPQGLPAQQAPGPPRAQPPPGWGATQAPGFPGPQQPQGLPAQQAPGPPRAQPPPGWGATQAPGFPGPQQPQGLPAQQAPGPPRAQPPPGWGATQAPGFPGPQQPQGLPAQQAPGPPRAQPPPGWGASQPASARTQAGPPTDAGRGRGQPAPQARPAIAPGQKQGAGDSSLRRIPLKIPGNTVRSRSIQVLTNYLAMTIKPLKIHRYDVSFKPDKPKKMIAPAFVLSKNKHFPKHRIAFDQMKNCYALTELPGVNQIDRFITNVEYVDNNGRTIPVEVSYKKTGVVDLKNIMDYMTKGGTSLCPPTEAIQCIDVILRQGTLESYIKAGKQFFKRPARPIVLGDGLEMWTGLFQSAIFTSRAFVNVDVAHKGFPIQQHMIKAIINDFRLDPTKPLDQQRGRGIENFKMFIKGLRVIATIGGDNSAKGQKREFICNDIVDPPNRITFPCTDAAGNTKTMTVADYFLKEKRIRLQYPNLNCMWVGPRDKKIFYPMELLEVSYGQPINKQLNEMQLSTMVKEAATPPDQRKAKIEEIIRDMNYSQNTYFKDFGLNISDQFYPVKAKVLQAPRLEVGGGQTIEPRKGAWQANRLLQPQALDSWAVVSLELDPRASNAETIIDLFMSVGGQLGMRVTKPIERFSNVRMQDFTGTLQTCVQKGIKFVVVVVSGRGRDYYQRVKQSAERHVGILTQCIKEMTAQRRMNPQTARNLLLKVNSKLMGVNQALDQRNMPKCLVGGGVMLVGADVTHPSPDQTSVPSIAAVTASVDTKGFIYNIALSVQTPKKEMIVEFEDMMVEHLQLYRKNLKQLPKRIYVFRDGVSEGQFAQVMNSELQAVHNAYRRLTGTETKPEVLFLLVQKRHHTRLFLGAHNSQNVEPGTVVDTDIVHAQELDFYLVSHQAIKGTARPTRYHAVCNDSRIPDDEVQQLTYFLCHLYSRCMRSVSYPTPTYYAHLACMRARSLTYGEKFDNARLEREPQRLRVLDRMLEYSSMFFV